TVAKNKDAFVGLGRVAFAHVLAHWENEDEAEAKRHYLEREATFEERRAAMHAAGDAVVKARKER
ncbi:MAG: hypothetical protein GWO24_28835, partial [Akkermansiaceae bacterium]|nr:hypothetical protein [Akkermansiaceae bacterium]